MGQWQALGKEYLAFRRGLVRRLPKQQIHVSVLHCVVVYALCTPFDHAHFCLPKGRTAGNSRAVVFHLRFDNSKPFHRVLRQLPYTPFPTAHAAVESSLTLLGLATGHTVESVGVDSVGSSTRVTPRSMDWKEIPRGFGPASLRLMRTAFIPVSITSMRGRFP